MSATANRHLSWSYPLTDGQLLDVLAHWDAQVLLTARQCLGNTLSPGVNYEDARLITAHAWAHMYGQTTRHQEGESPGA